MTSAISAFGTSLKRGAVAVAEVTDISGPGLSVDTADVSAHDGPGWREHIPTLADGGEITVEINYVPTNATHSAAASGLLDDLRDKTVTTWSITFPDTTVWSFSAMVTGFEPGAPTDEGLTASVTFKLTGAPTLA